MRDLGTLHSPQHRGYPDASSRPLPPSGGETLPDLLPCPISAAIGHTLITLQQRIAQLEAELERRADVVSDQADKLAIKTEDVRRFSVHLYCCNVQLEWAVEFLTLSERAQLAEMWQKNEASIVAKACANS